MTDFEPPTRAEWIVTWVISLLVVFGIMLSVYTSEADAATKRCRVPATITAKHHPTTRHQRANVNIALRTAVRMRAPRKHQYALIAAATQEDKLRNRPVGHSSSVGFLQLLNIHGTVAWRMRVENSSGWFLRGARKVDRPWLTVAQLAQRVQRSAHPHAYKQWVRESRRTVLGYHASCR